jgi:hypothetical protein
LFEEGVNDYSNPAPKTKRNPSTGTNMPTPDQCEATYHGGNGELLTAAYQREFSMLEKGRCKTKFPTLSEWHAELNAQVGK